MLGSVTPSSFGCVALGYLLTSSGVIFCVHHNATRLPVQMAKHLFRGAFTIEKGSVKFVVATLLEDIKDGATVGECMDASLFSA